MPKFTPVPLRYRKDGWTPLRQADFLGRLAETRSVTDAARHVAMTREGAYRLRAKPGADSFAAAWDSILAKPRGERRRKSTYDLLRHRAEHGTLQPLMRAGKHVGTRHSPDDKAFMRLLRATLSALAAAAAAPKVASETCAIRTSFVTFG